jgi:hypothetical protein
LSHIGIYHVKMFLRSSINKRRAALCPKLPDSVAELAIIPGKTIAQFSYDAVQESYLSVLITMVM